MTPTSQVPQPTPKVCLSVYPPCRHHDGPMTPTCSFCLFSIHTVSSVTVNCSSWSSSISSTCKKTFKKKHFPKYQPVFPGACEPRQGQVFPPHFRGKVFSFSFDGFPEKKRHKSFSPDGFPGGFPRCHSAKSVRRGEGCSRRSAQTQTASRPTPTTFSRPSTTFPGAALAETWH